MKTSEKNVANTLFEVTQDWKTVSEMLKVIPKKDLVEMADLLIHVLDNPYASGSVCVKDARNSGRKEKLRALTAKTRYECSAPRNVWYSQNTTLEKSWASKGVKIGEERSVERYISEDFLGADYRHEYEETSKKPTLRFGHGWAVTFVKTKTDGDNYDWPEEDYCYNIILV